MQKKSRTTTIRLFSICQCLNLMTLVNYKDGLLTVAGSRKSFKDTSDKDKNIIHKERSEGRISRSYRLPNIVASEIHAKYDNGVLTIILPKQNAGDDSNSIHID